MVTCLNVLYRRSSEETAKNNGKPWGYRCTKAPVITKPSVMDLVNYNDVMTAGNALKYLTF